jgi:hypothetical protein
MDEQSNDAPAQEHNRDQRRGRGFVTALLVAVAVAAVPAGVALAGGSGGPAAGDGDSPGAVPAQATTPGDGRRDRGQGDRGDCPEKDGRGGEESTEI